MILLILPPRIVLAESEEIDSKKACDYIENVALQKIDSSESEVTSDQTEVGPNNDDVEVEKIESAVDLKQEAEQTDVADLPGHSTDNPELTQQSTDNKDELPEESQVALAGISIPSLWWAREQFDPFGGKLISNWLTNPQVKQIDLVVNWQFWTLLDYLGRYRFINQFGTVAREHGYDLRIFNQQKQCLALYEYNQVTNPPKWEIKIDGFGQESLQVLPDIN